MDCKRNFVIIEVIVAKNANTTQHYNEVELEKEATCKEYLQVDELEKEATCVKIAQVQNKNVHFLHVNGVKKTVP
jgi:dihydroorotase-like cyclic amidohydrolase